MIVRLVTGFPALLLAALFVLATLTAEPAHAGSETPPEGPPWVRDIVVAQRDAITRKVPVFVYLTKTH